MGPFYVHQLLWCLTLAHKMVPVYRVSYVLLWVNLVYSDYCRVLLNHESWLTTMGEPGAFLGQGHTFAAVIPSNVQNILRQTGVTGLGLAPDSSSGGASILRMFSPPGVSVLGHPRVWFPPFIGTLVLGYFLYWSANPRILPPLEHKS